MGMALSHLASMQMMPANTPYAGSAALQTSTGCMLSCALAAWLPSYVCLVCAECTKVAALLPLRQARKISSVNNGWVYLNIVNALGHNTHPLGQAK